MFERKTPAVTPWAIGVSAAGAAAAAAYGVLRLVRSRGPGAMPRSALDALEEAAVEELRRDEVTGSAPIDVAAIAPGIIELTGVIATNDVGQRAARLLHSVPGVRTVINRLDTGTVEEQLALNRERRARGEPAARERHWYGVGVGMGRRRQSAETDPARPDDSVQRRSRELEVSPSDLADAASAQSPPEGLP